MSASAGSQERLRHPDALRGLALALILPANLVIAGSAGSADSPTVLLVRLLAEGKGFALFAFLFGWGFAILLESGVNPNRYLRRMVVLAGIGLLHAILLWPGDILLPYALIGGLLVVFRCITSPRLVALALVTLIIPSLQHGMMWALGLAGEMGTPHRIAAGPFRLGDWWSQIVGLMTYGWTILGCMLLGVAARRVRFLESASVPSGWLWALLAVAGVVHLPLLAAGGTSGVWLNLWAGMAPIAGPALAGFYVLAALRWGLPSAVAWLGRMPLTHYVSQSLVLVVLAYLAWTGSAVVLGATSIVLLAQFGLSRVWLRRRRHGPLETAWRRQSGQLPKRDAIPDPSGVDKA